MRARLVPLFSATGQRALVLTTVVLVLYLGTLTVAKTIETYATHQEAARVRAEIERLHERYAQLEMLHDYELTDDFVEQVARRELNLIKPGETAVIVIAPTPAASEDAPVVVQKRRPWWRAVLGRVLGWSGLEG